MVMAYLIYCKQLSFEQAYERVKTWKPDIDPNIGFVSQLKDLSSYCEHNRDILDPNVFNYQAYKDDECNNSGKLSFNWLILTLVTN